MKTQKTGCMLLLGFLRLLLSQSFFGAVLLLGLALKEGVQTRGSEEAKEVEKCRNEKCRSSIEVKWPGRVQSS